MEIQGKIEVGDYVSAQRLHRTRPITANLFFIGVLAFTLLIAFFATISMLIGNPQYQLLVPLALVAVIYSLNRYIWFPNRFKKRFEKETDFKIPFQLEITEAGTVYQTEFKKNSWSWSMFIRWKENREILLLYLSEEEFLIFPKRLLTEEQVSTVKEYLNHKKIPFYRARNIPIEGSLLYLIILCVIVFFLSIAFNNTPQ